MTLVALDGTPLVAVGNANRNGTPSMSALANTTLDAANEAAIMYGYVFNDDLGSHTIDTTGSSSLQWRTSTTTFANAGTTVKVGLAAMDTSTGPPGRAVNVADVITFDVSRTMVGGGGGVTTAAWQTHVPDAGTKTVAHGDLIAFAVQMTARAGADSVLVSAETNLGPAYALPAVTAFTGGAYATAGAMPNCVITYSDGHLGYFFGGFVASTVLSTSWNSSGATKEYGNYVQLPFPAKCYGLLAGVNVQANVDIILYSDPFGTPVAEKTVSIDANAIAAGGASAPGALLFPAPFQMAANTPYAVVVKPTTTTNVSMFFKTFNTSAHQTAENGNGYAIFRASGAFAAQNSQKDRYQVGLLLGAFDAGGGGMASPLFGGMAVT